MGILHGNVRECVSDFWGDYPLKSVGRRGGYRSAYRIRMNLDNKSLLKNPYYETERAQASSSIGLRNRRCIRVEGTDSGVICSSQHQCRNEPPTIAIDNNKVGASAGLRIGKVSGSDPERSKVTVVMSPDEENIDNELFTFSKGTLYTKGPYDFETRPILTLRFEASDGTLVTTQDIEILLTDVNEPASPSQYHPPQSTRVNLLER